MEEDQIVRTCPECGEPMPEKDKHETCKACRKEQRKIKRKEWWDKHGALVAFLGIGAGVVAAGAALSKAGISLGEGEEPDEDSEDEGYPVGEKYWNKERGRWEKDGEPYTFLVGWTDVRDGEHHEREFSDVDDGYEAYEDKKKQWFASGVTWDHIPPDDDDDEEDDEDD